MTKKQVTTRKMVISAMLAAMYVALCFLKIRIGTLQITVSSLPVIMGGLLFGPLWGFAVGFALGLVLLATTRPVAGKWYLYPLFPFHRKELSHLLLRHPTNRDNT